MHGNERDGKKREINKTQKKKKEGKKENKSPRGLNAHLNWRKLPVVHLGVCHQSEKLWGPSPGPPWGHVYHLNNSESPTPKDVFWIRWNSYCLGPLPEPITSPRAHWGHPLGTAMNNFNSSHKKVFEYYITWLFYFWIWRRCYFEICMVLALGSPLPGPPWVPHVPYEWLWIPGP